MEEKKTLMITGASGFVGSNFIDKYKGEYNIIPVCLIENTPESLDYSNIDCVLHLAALVHQMKGALEEKYFEVNTELTRRLATEAKKSGVKHFVFYSTVAVWGTHGYFDHDRVITLKTPTNPKTPYGRSKLEGEKILQELQNENFKICVLRPPMIHGKNCPGNLPKLESLVKKLPIVPFGNTSNKRTMVHIDRLVEETNLAIKGEKIGIYIPKDREERSLKEVVCVLAGGEKKIMVPMPQILLLILKKLKPSITESLFGSLLFSEGEIENGKAD